MANFLPSKSTLVIDSNFQNMVAPNKTETAKGPEKPMNPLTVSFDDISHDIIGIHNPLATWQNVDSLFNVVSDIVRSSTNVAEFLDLQGSKKVELIRPAKMACDPFNPSTAHETIKGILEKLKSYNWDAKAVIALAAFALDYGESCSWRLSLTQATQQNSLDQLHVFRLGGFEKDKPTQPTAKFSSLVDSTLQVIEKIIALEKKIADKNVKLRDVSDLPAHKTEVYTYWAIFALACASQITQLDKGIRSEVRSRLSAIIRELDDILGKIKIDEAYKADYNWALHVIKTPSGILVLLKALIFLNNVGNLEIFDATSNQAASLDVIAKQHLFLFISDLDNIEKKILEEFNSIACEFKKDINKQHYRILWIPVAEKWTKALQDKFEIIKSKVPWYVVKHFAPLRGIGILQRKFGYSGRPIVLVTNPRGDIICENAMQLILAGGIKALPFLSAGGEGIERGDWFWWAASKVPSLIENWVRNDQNYIFFYGGVDNEVTQSLAELINNIKTATESVASIEHFKLGTAADALKFWESIENSFCSNVFAIEDIGKILSMKEEKGWVLVSKGKNILLTDSHPLITNVLKDFKNDWKKYVEGGFENAFPELHEKWRPKSSRDCSHFEVVGIRSSVPTTLACLDCDMKVQIKSVRYECCHGKHDSDTYAEVAAMPNVQDRNDVSQGEHS